MRQCGLQSTFFCLCNFYPRTPNGVRHTTPGNYRWAVPFLSTHSKRSATCAPHTTLSSFCYFYPRTPNGVRQAYRTIQHRYLWISIHALQTECDLYQYCNPPYRLKFLSTHSKRSATGRKKTQKRQICISIHALQTECDTVQVPVIAVLAYFYPRTPNGVRQSCLEFQ